MIDNISTYTQSCDTLKSIRMLWQCFDVAIDMLISLIVLALDWCRNICRERAFQMYGVELNVRRDLKLPLKGDPGSAVANGGYRCPNEIAFDPDATAELMTAGIKSSPVLILF